MFHASVVNQNDITVSSHFLITLKEVQKQHIKRSFPASDPQKHRRLSLLGLGGGHPYLPAIFPQELAEFTA